MKAVIATSELRPKLRELAHAVEAAAALVPGVEGFAQLDLEIGDVLDRIWTLDWELELREAELLLAETNPPPNAADRRTHGAH